MIFLEIAGHLVFWLVMIAGVGIILLGLPGTFLMVGNTVVFGWLTGFQKASWSLIGVLLLIAVIVEVIEFLVSAAAAAKFGASKPAMIGAVVGGFVGAIWASAVLPLIGTVAGAFVGAFLGAALVEYLQSHHLEKSLLAGFGAFLGALGGKFTKILAALAMAIIVAASIY